MNPARNKIAGFDYVQTLTRAEQVIRWVPDPEPSPLVQPAHESLQVGVDLGTAYIVLVVLDSECKPLAGEYQFAQVVRDGLVVDFLGAVDLLAEMKARVERRLGVPLTNAATGYPPGVHQVEVRATGNVIEAAGLHCTRMIDEPSAANTLLGLENGAIVDVGGGTTGIAVLKDGEVVYTADEATGGTHFSLVIAGAQDISFEAAEQMKVDPNEQARLFPAVRPVMEKVASIVARHIAKSQIQVDSLTLVGGTSSYPGIAGVVEEYTGLPVSVPDRPVFVTPLGIAMNDKEPGSSLN